MSTGRYAYVTSNVPEFAGRRNGRAPRSGEYAPIATAGNAGLNDVDAPNAFVTSASRYVYDPLTRTLLPAIASNDASIPCALNDCEFTYAPNAVAAAAAGGTPAVTSADLPRNSSRSSNSLLKY